MISLIPLCLLWAAVTIGDAFVIRGSVVTHNVRPNISIRIPSYKIPPRNLPTGLKVSSISFADEKETSTSTWLHPWKAWSRVFTVSANIFTSFRSNEVWQWRTAIGSFFVGLILFRQAVDIKLSVLWRYLLTSQSLAARIFRTDSYEWVLAISCFVVYVHAFGYADHVVRKADEQDRVHPWKKYRLQDRYEADKRRRSVDAKRQKGENELPSDDEAPLRVQHSPWNWQAWLCELWVYALPLMTWDILAPRRHRRLAAFAAPTTLGILGGITGGLLLYDIFFFCGHILMHRIPFLYRNIHAKHHKIQEVRAGEIVRLSIPEEVLEVGFSIVALNLLGVHPLARSIYNIIITFLLTELHCGFDFPWTPQNVIPLGLATGSRRHHYHHRFGRHYYQKFFFSVDRLFGFFQKDDGSVLGDSVKAKPFIPAGWK